MNNSLQDLLNDKKKIIVLKDCPYCKHHKAFNNLKDGRTYTYKCCKCKKIIR